MDDIIMEYNSFELIKDDIWNTIHDFSDTLMFLLVCTIDLSTSKISYKEVGKWDFYE